MIFGRFAVDLLGELVLFFVEFAGLLSEIADGFIEAGGGGVAEVFAEFVELAFCAGAFCDGFGEFSFVHCAGGFLDVVASFLHLLLDLLLGLAAFRLLILGCL